MILKQLEKKWTRRVLVLALLLCALFFAFPIVWMLLTSLKTRNDFLAMPPKWVFRPTLENFREIFSSGDFVKAYINSILISVCSVTIGIAIGVPCAYGMSRFHFRGKSGLAFWILSTRFAPPIAVLLPFFLLFKALGLSDTHVGLILVYLIINLPLIIWIMNGFFRDIPIEMEEAAIIDGANPFQAFFRIVLPLVAPGLVATLILSLIFCWNELLFSMILSAYRTRTLPVAIYNFVSYQEIAWGNLSAAGMSAILPVAVFTLIIQKHLVSGLTFGAVKS